MQPVNKEEFLRLQDEMQGQDDLRERVIKEMREAQKASKNSIFALHRRDFAGAKGKLDAARKVIDRFLPIVRDNPDLRRGTFSSAVEEYVEACAFERFLQDGSLITVSDLNGICNAEEYLGGVADLIGEMVRYAVLEATQRNVTAVQKCQALGSDVLAAFMEFDFRNGALRKKSDGIKYGVKRFEEILYDLSLIPNDGRSINASDLAEHELPAPAKRTKTSDEEEQEEGI